MRILDLAEKIHLSSSFISAVEIGKKPIPAGYLDSVVKVMDLTRIEAVTLLRVADRSRTVADVEGLQGDHREFVAAFARKLQDFSPDLLEEIKIQAFESPNTVDTASNTRSDKMIYS